MSQRIPHTLCYAPNVSWVFPELPFAGRVRAVAEEGFATIEFNFASHADIPALRSLQREYGLQVALFNLDVPAWGDACRGYLADPRWRTEFDRQFERALDLAGRLACPRVMIPIGNRVPEMSRQAQQEQIIENLRRVAPVAERHGITLTIEALNQADNPGYYLSSSQEAFEILNAVDHPSVRFQYDFYHMQLMEGNLINTLTANIDHIAHFQVADVPGRHEPGTGEINFVRVLQAVAATGYRGAVGLEYRPLDGSHAALAWVPAQARGRNS